jgi:hypothetical protein
MRERVAALRRADPGDPVEQAFARIEKQGFHSLLDYSAIGLDYQHNGVGSTRSYMDKNHEAMNRFMKALVEGIHRYKTDRAFGLKVLERHLRVSDPEVVQTAYDYYAPKTPTVPYVNVKGMKSVLDTPPRPVPRRRAPGRKTWSTTAPCRD